MKIVRGLLLALITALATGCVIQPEGQGFSYLPDEDDWREIENQLLLNRDAARSEGLQVDNTTPGVIVIGRVGPFRDFSDERVFEDGYRRYEKIMNNIGQPDNILTKSELKAVAAGWTTITYAGIPQLGFLFSRAYVKPDQLRTLDFSSVAGSFLGGAREDLVAAVSTLEFPFFIISALLCEDGSGYSECSREYESGLYDIYSGKELNTEYEIKSNGTIIDIGSFRVAAGKD